MEPYTITTSYPDGRTEQRLATPEEVAQREADIANAEKEEAERQAAEQEAAETLLSGLTKLIELGLSEKEAAAVSGVHNLNTLKTTAQGVN